MSNLNSSVLFDVVRGWPNGSAVEECFPPETGRTLREGQLVVLESDGQVDDRGWTLQTEGGETPNMFRMVIQGNDQPDANFVGKVVTLRGAFTVETEKVVGAGFAPGDKLTVSSGSGTEGYLVEVTAANEQIVGVVEAWDAATGKLTAALSL